MAQSPGGCALTRRQLVGAGLAIGAAWVVDGCGGSATTTRTATETGSFSAQIEAISQGIVASGAAVGAAAAAVEGGKRNAWGAGALRQDGSAAEATSLFEIGSITKVFTATLLARAVVEGRVSLNTTIDSYLPAGTRLMPQVAHRITLQMLATHSAGLPRNPLNQRRGANGNVIDYSQAELAAFLSSWQPSFPPGTRTGYSNIGFGLLGYVLGRVYGTGWADALAQHVTGPLGMRDTVAAVPGNERVRSAQGYSARRPTSALVSPSFLGGGGVLKSTAEDMAAFLSAQLDPTGVAGPLSEAIRLTQRPYINLPSGGAQALGWMLHAATGGSEALMKDGVTTGFSALVGADRQMRRAFYVVANNHDATRRLRAAAEALGITSKR